MTDIERTPGQSPILPGSTIANGVVYTSGIVSPRAFAAIGSDTVIPFADQVSEAVYQLLVVLAASGTSADRVLKIDAYLADAADTARWNEEFLKVWPDLRPARTTLVTGFTSPVILFELQAIAVL